MSVEENIAHIHARIKKTAATYGRSPHDTHLIAVSKRQSQEKIQAALNAGHRLFGENHVQEAKAHWQDLKPLYPDVKLHLIGPLQTNKIKEALDLFDVIETIDREKLARKLGEALQKQGRAMPCFIQVNIGEETQKSGVMPHALPDFLTFCKQECALDIQGLMCIPPADEPAALYFALLQKMARQHNLPHLSMGMSGDFEKAVALGATYVRIGTGIFTPPPPPDRHDKPRHQERRI